MKYGLVTICFNEERFLPKFLSHVPKWIDETLVLVSAMPWQGKNEKPDETDLIAESMGATTVVGYWKSEEEQRQAGQDYFYDKDWVIVLDPDEYLTKKDWSNLKEFLEHAEANAYVCDRQLTYWKSGFRIDPPEDYVQIIATRPSVRFIDKRVVDSGYGRAPVTLHHMSWARTNAECLSKISHYAHAHELDKSWYEEVWLMDKRENVHPMTPEALKKVIPTKLPKELESLDIWPPA